MEIAGSIVRQTSDVEAIWDRLTPVLDEVQAMLSQQCSRRQERRARGLPTWQEWRKTFLETSGLDVSERTAQRHLKALRELMDPDAKKTTTHARKVSSAELQKLLRTQRAVHELGAALRQGDDPSNALERVVASDITSDRLSEMIANSPAPRNAYSMSDSHAGLDTPLTSSEISYRLSHLGSAKTCELDFKRGGVPLLAEYFTVEHSAEIKVVFGSLSLAEKHEALKDLFAAIEKAILHVDDVRGALQLPGEGLAEDREPLQAA
jgi:hypothetical protein